MKEPRQADLWALWGGSVVILLWLLLQVFGCNYSIPKDITIHVEGVPGNPTNPGNPDPKPTPVATLTYKNVSNTISGYCLRCHAGPTGSGGVSLTSYQEVMNYVTPGKPDASKLCDVLQKKRMPPGSPLSQKFSDDICKWIEQGAKES